MSDPISSISSPGDTCKNRGEGDRLLCGPDPRVEIMTSEDAEVSCGVWKIQVQFQKRETVFNISSINIHPDYQISRGSARSQYVKADIATIHVGDVDPEIFDDKNKLFPACLPTSNNTDRGFAIQSGWSTPPPREFLENNIPNYIPFRRDFKKQWHYRMQIKQCKDPSKADLLRIKDKFEPKLVDELEEFPTNTFYPPRTICATEYSDRMSFCPTSGESGSPLMRTDNGRYSVDGILSFVKELFINDVFHFFGLFREGSKKSPKSK